MNQFITINMYENECLLFKEKTQAKINNKSLTYQLNNDTITFNFKPFLFKKENQESILTITENECSLYLKELQNYLNIPLETLNFSYENSIIFEYKLNSMEHNIKIIIEGDVTNV